MSIQTSDFKNTREEKLKEYELWCIQYYLFDKPLAEGGTDPLSGMDAAVDPHGFLLVAIFLSYLTRPETSD